MYPSSQHKSWTARPAAHASPSYGPSTLPGPMPGAPHLHTVSLPHPNSAPSYASASSSSQYYEGSSGIARINPLLGVHAVPPVHFNVARDVQYIQFHPGCPQNLLDAPAIDPSRAVLVLCIPSLPQWSTIEVRNRAGVTARDVFVRIRDALNRSVSAAEMGMMGVKRIDFLGPNVLFAGLTTSRDGMDRLEVHFAPGA